MRAVVGRQGARRPWLVTSIRYALGRVSREDEIVSPHTRFVAGEARPMLSLVDRPPVDEASEAPAAGGGVLLGILDHHLDGRGGARHPGWRELRRLHPLPGELDQDRS